MTGSPQDNPDGDETRRGLSRVDVTEGPGAIRALQELITSGGLPGVYVKAGQIVATERVSGVTELEADEDAPLPISATTVNPPVLASLLARHTFTYRTARGGVEEFTPAREILAAALSPREWPGVNPLHGIVGAPVLRRDGTLLQTPGYDPATGLFLAPTVPIDPIPERPSAEQVDEARSFLLERFLVDFPWIDKADLANYLALLVTPVLRPFLRCLAPFGIITATMPGSGKTILTAAVGLLYGQRVLSWPDSNEELRKAITAVMAQPVGAVVFDNLAEGAVIESPILARLITEHTWSDRRLGSSANVAFANDRLWLATGNNLRVGGDIASRSVLVRLDPDMPHPEERSGFTIPDLPQWILSSANRRVLLRHLLTLVVDWCAAGAPQAGGVTMRQFTPWARAVGGFLAHHGIDGLLTNVNEVRATDETDERWTAFLARWWHLRGDTPFLSHELHATAPEQPGGSGDDPWRGTFITGPTGRIPNPISLGRLLFGQIGHWHGDYVLRSTMSDRSDRRTWHVEHRTHAASQPADVDDTDTAGVQGQLDTNGWPADTIGAAESTRHGHNGA